MSNEVLLAFIGALATIIGGGIVAYGQYKGKRQDAIGQLSESYKLILVRLDQLQDEVDEEKDKRRTLQLLVFDYQMGVAILVAQLLKMGVKPEWTPPKPGEKKEEKESQEEKEEK